ncbi:DUF1015 domain-containing protein [Methanosarcina sp. MSH10X1]|uniref:DUF1015 domain-containing protein n=1 Tax=Methanosarcina sp. MSH10X1 TaxID=2507075 RepID=UPI000FFB12CA|nr:DUF1015 domain-containing protein [Methanosarcina sp. MSH10X1]RXA17618.1 DUF1015 domain-containing protein [Methanosarcina sp. MSH10X1]
MVLHVPRILLPKDNWEKWAVIACDQHTQDLEYWKRIEKFIGDAPSTFKLIYPEIYLPLDENRVNKIHKTLSDYKEILVDHGSCFILVKRSVSGGERTGLVVAVDLEKYQFNGSDSFIRPTEGTIRARLPARVRIRENAELELSHILVLYDDPDFMVIPGNPDDLVCEDNQVYDFDLMENGGHITGYRISDGKIIKEISDKILNLGTLLVGDGNHSLAAAKSFWEKIKGTVNADHPARYAMVELVNIHDPGLSFEPIHRVVSGIDPGELLRKFDARIEKVQSCPSNMDFQAMGHSIGFITKDSCGIMVFENPAHELEVETLDEIIDNYSIEYEHDPEVVEKLGREQGNTGFFLPPLKKSEFFSLIKKKGVLPRKSFSLGKENEKRYYIEVRKITP